MKDRQKHENPALGLSNLVGQRGSEQRVGGANAAAGGGMRRIPPQLQEFGLQPYLVDALRFCCQGVADALSIDVWQADSPGGACQRLINLSPQLFVGLLEVTQDHFHRIRPADPSKHARSPAPDRGVFEAVVQHSR